MSSLRAIAKSFQLRCMEDILKELESRLKKGEITQKIYDYMAELINSIIEE